MTVFIICQCVYQIVSFLLWMYLFVAPYWQKTLKRFFFVGEWSLSKPEPMFWLNILEMCWLFQNMEYTYSFWNNRSDWVQILRKFRCTCYDSLEILPISVTVKDSFFQKKAHKIFKILFLLLIVIFKFKIVPTEMHFIN